MAGAAGTNSHRSYDADRYRVSAQFQAGSDPLNILKGHCFKSLLLKLKSYLIHLYPFFKAAKLLVCKFYPNVSFNSKTDRFFNCSAEIPFLGNLSYPQKVSRITK